jgi:hypothetical protein
VAAAAVTALVIFTAPWWALRKQAASVGLAATIVSMEDSRESVMYRVVEIRFSNPGGAPRRLKKYVLTWTGGRKEASSEPANLAAGESCVRHLRVWSSDGDLSSLSSSTAHVSVIPD